MGKEIIWSPTSINQLEDIHFEIWNTSKSLKSAVKVVNHILDSANILTTQPEIYTLDEYKENNDNSYRSYETKKYPYRVSYRVLEHNIRIIRVRYSGKERRLY